VVKGMHTTEGLPVTDSTYKLLVN